MASRLRKHNKGIFFWISQPLAIKKGGTELRVSLYSSCCKGSIGKYDKLLRERLGSVKKLYFNSDC